jgi:hypothetical protein
LNPASSSAHSISTGIPDVLDSPQQATQLERLRAIQARLGGAARHGTGTVAQPTRWNLRPGTASQTPAPSSRLKTMRSGTTSPCAIAEPSQVAFRTMPVSAVRLNPPPETRADTSG